MGKWSGKFNPIPVILVSLIAITPAAAARPQSMTWAPSFWPLPQQPVEQQTPGGATQPDQSLWVTNPYTFPLPQSEWCVWDADDRIDGRFWGVIGPGETVTATACLILDQRDHEAFVMVEPPLVGSVRVGSVSGSCIETPEYDSSEVPFLPEIEGSNGGHGVKTIIEWSVTNPTNRTIRKSIALTSVRWRTTVDPCGAVQARATAGAWTVLQDRDQNIVGNYYQCPIEPGMGENDEWTHIAEGQLVGSYEVTSPRPTCVGAIARAAFRWLGKGKAPPFGIEIIDPSGGTSPYIATETTIVASKQGVATWVQVCMYSLSEPYGHFTFRITGNGPVRFGVRLAPPEFDDCSWWPSQLGNWGL